MDIGFHMNIVTTIVWVFTECHTSSVLKTSSSPIFLVKILHFLNDLEGQFLKATRLKYSTHISSGDDLSPLDNWNLMTSLRVDQVHKLRPQ